MNTAEALNIDPLEKPEEQDPLDPKNKEAKDKTDGLSKTQIDLMNKGKLGISEIKRENEENQRRAKDELKEMRRDNKEDKEQMDFIRRLEEAKDNPEETKRILKEIEELKRKKEKQEMTAEEEAKPLDFKSKEIQAYVKEIGDLFDTSKNPKIAAYLGTNQVKQFKEWGIEALQKHPRISIKSAKEILAKIKNDREDGIKPRQEYFEKSVDPLLKKYGMTLENSPLFKSEGKSERERAVKLVDKTEKRLEGMKNAGLYSQKAITEIIRGMLTVQSESDQQEMEKRINDVIEAEATSYTNQESSIFDRKMVTVHGLQYRAMSKKSKELYLADYKNYDLKTREKLVTNWEKMIENEGKLIEELGEVYKKDPEGFKKAMANFELMSYQEKEKALKDHRFLVENNDKETLHKSQETIGKALKAIEDARSKKILSDTTAKKFRALFANKETYTDPKTGKIDLKKLDKMHEKLTSKTPETSRENRNISAYSAQKEGFQKMLDKAEKDFPELKGQDAKKWQEQFNEGTYGERNKTFQDLIALINKKRSEKAAQEKNLKASGIEKKETAEKVLSRAELIVKVTETRAMLKDPNISEEIKIREITKTFQSLCAYGVAHPNCFVEDPAIGQLFEDINNAKNALGLNKQTSKTEEEKAEQEQEDAVKQTMSQETTKDNVTRLNIQRVNIEETQKSQRKHQQISAQDRSKTEAMQRASGDEKAQEIIKDYYEITDDKHGLQRDQETGGKDTGSEFVEVKFQEQEVPMTKEQLQVQKRRLLKHKDRMIKKEGFTHVKITDQSGKELEAKEALVRQKEKEDQLENKIAEETEKNLRTKGPSPKKEDSFASISTRLALKRKIAKEKERIAQDMLKETAQN